MNRMYIGLSILVIVAICFAWIFATAMREHENKFKKEIGRKVVVNKDTLLIVDYNQISETFSLSNGTTVSYTFIEKQLK